MTGYRVNRQSRGQTVRVVVDLPTDLVGALDEWGVGAGKQSRREATESLLVEALRTKGVPLERAS